MLLLALDLCVCSPCEVREHAFPVSLWAPSISLQVIRSLHHHLVLSCMSIFTGFLKMLTGCSCTSASPTLFRLILPEQPWLHFVCSFALARDGCQSSLTTHCEWLPYPLSFLITFPSQYTVSPSGTSSWTQQIWQYNRFGNIISAFISSYNVYICCISPSS